MSIGTPMVEASSRDQRFRRSVYLFIGALLFGYLTFKAWHITIAIKVFDDQVIEADGLGAAK